MSVPLPDHSLSGHCSGFHDNTLYVLNDDGRLQSLPLKVNATWADQERAQTVEGPACAQVAGQDAALFVVGGGSRADGYMGLQKYSFSSATWESLFPAVGVLQNRMNHSVTYLKDSDSILVYAGSLESSPSDLSSQTFLVSTQPPYNIRAFTSNAPPANKPILTSWNSSHAVMAGGQTLSNQIWLFGPNEGWTQLPTDLPEPLHPASRAALIDGEDGSKVLQVFDMHTSPNTAQGLVLLDENGQPARTGQLAGGSQSSDPQSQKRDLSLSDWPPYNSTNAPTITRIDCSIAQGPNRTIILAGGSDVEPIVMYNQKDNSWIDVNQLFNSKEQRILRPSSNPSTTATRTQTTQSMTATGESTDGGATSTSAHDRTMKTLGIALGTLCGIAALFILVLLFLRWRKLRQKNRYGGNLHEKQRDRAAEGAGNRLSFADRGASFMKEAGMTAHDLPLPDRTNLERTNAGSHSSLAIITNKWAGNKGNPYGHSQKASFESTAQLVKDKERNAIPAEDHEMMDIGTKRALPSSTLAVPEAVGTALDKDTRVERKRSSGWSKYFATSAPVGPHGLSHIPSAYVKPTEVGHDADSEYSTDMRRLSEASKIPSSALVPPLDIDFTKTMDGQRLSHVASKSPAFMDSREDLARTGSAGAMGDGQSGQIVDPRSSQATSVNSYDNRSTISSNVTSEYFHETHTPWTPMNGDVTDPGRATSSVYTNSVRAASRGRSTGFFPGAGTVYKPTAKVKLSATAGPSSEWASPKAPALFNKPAEDRDKARDSTVTVFPGADYLDSLPRTRGPQTTAGAHAESGPNNTDMSWLNLGLGSKREP
ncbi:hypothetical protein CERZMDRAFT_112958 [Cercospora zeae-maydis SCOH1-5]|uniref:Pre-mRNA splicing factor CLF1 n=1 Tax=Cercospora zeae-maydis SCOH1-5 TaxID=717836 RepID=A0A6A6FBK8_9PEZI|nr:hypothetical protein CERZMDRAFT_112958 [Cercospora zeae-maydis SCOH1-5]